MHLKDSYPRSHKTPEQFERPLLTILNAQELPKADFRIGPNDASLGERVAAL
jgi:hypothetical protein